MIYGEFPKMLYVRQEQDDDVVYVVSGETVEEAMDEDESQEIGVYVLTHTVTAEKKVVFKKKGVRK